MYRFRFLLVLLGACKAVLGQPQAGEEAEVHLLHLPPGAAANEAPHAAFVHGVHVLAQGCADLFGGADGDVLRQFLLGGGGAVDHLDHGAVVVQSVAAHDDGGPVLHQLVADGVRYLYPVNLSAPHDVGGECAFLCHNQTSVIVRLKRSRRSFFFISYWAVLVARLLTSSTTGSQTTVPYLSGAVGRS